MGPPALEPVAKLGAVRSPTRVANESAAASAAATIHLQLPYRTKVNLKGIQPLRGWSAGLSVPQAPILRQLSECSMPAGFSGGSAAPAPPRRGGGAGKAAPTPRGGATPGAT